VQIHGRPEAAKDIRRSIYFCHVKDCINRPPPAKRRLTNEHSPLTKRERHIILVLSGGLTNKEIGRRLKLAEGTVKVHLHHIYRKLGIANRTELAVLAHTKTFDAA
jgi:DNA-binding NarL/FixJ family response regulator